MYRLRCLSVSFARRKQIRCFNGEGSEGKFCNFPKAEHLVSVTKHWYEEFVAVPAVICESINEFTVPQPVGEEESLPLAQEHYAFCTDIIDQSLGTINALADVLRKSTV